jgi:hypothetical protein
MTAERGNGANSFVGQCRGSYLLLSFPETDPGVDDDDMDPDPSADQPLRRAPRCTKGSHPFFGQGKKAKDQTMDSLAKTMVAAAEKRRALDLRRSARSFAHVSLFTGTGLDHMFIVPSFLGYKCPAAWTFCKAQLATIPTLEQCAME